MRIEKSSFGKTADGREATLYTMINGNGMQVSVTDYGATLVRVMVPDKDGRLVDCVLGYDDVYGYEHNSGSIGCFVGRNANRIAGAKVVIGGKTYELEKNDGENNLHSGSVRSAKFYYDTAVKEGEEVCAVAFARVMPDMEQGFPGFLDVTVTYSLTESNALVIDYAASCSEDTVVNMTNHSYFNLSGEGSGDVLDHVLTMKADKYTPVGPDLIPTGEIADVAGTALDFRTPKAIGRDIDGDDPLVKGAGGYDHNFVLDTRPGEVSLAAVVTSPKTGITMEVLTDLPGLQLYTANGLGLKVPGKGGHMYGPREGVCFETQYFPNACNEPKFRSSILPAGEFWQSETVYRFK